MPSIRPAGRCDALCRRRGATRSRASSASRTAVGAILARRGYATPTRRARFLAADERHDPLPLPGVRAACELILATSSAARGSWCTATTTWTACARPRSWCARCARSAPTRAGTCRAARRRLRALGRRGRAARRARASACSITVDCGDHRGREVAARPRARHRRDRHRPPPARRRAARLPDRAPGARRLPVPRAVRRRRGAQARRGAPGAAGRDPARPRSDLDLAALATVCDLVPLRGENRRIVREGLAALARTHEAGAARADARGGGRAGRADRARARLPARPAASTRPGRLQRADAALELLLTETSERAARGGRRARPAQPRAPARPRRGSCSRPRPPARRRPSARRDRGGRRGLAPGRGRDRGLAAGRAPPPPVRGDRARRRGAAAARGAASPPYDLHAGLAACAEHLTRFGGHRMAAGARARRAARSTRSARAFAAHAGAALAPEDLIAGRARRRGGARRRARARRWPRSSSALRPFGHGNPQPTLLVPAARIERRRARWARSASTRASRSSAGGARARGGRVPHAAAALAPRGGRAATTSRVRLERNRWNGSGRAARGAARALPDRARRAARARRGRATSGSALRRPRCGRRRSGSPRRRRPSPDAAPSLVDRRGEGIAGVAGDLLTSGEPRARRVADVPRRRAGLEQLVAGLGARAADGGRRPGRAIAADPALARRPRHLVALDPPPRRRWPTRCCAPARGAPTWRGARPRPTSRCRLARRARPAPGADRRLPGAARAPAEADPDVLQDGARGDGRTRARRRAARAWSRVLLELGSDRARRRRPSCRVLEATRPTSSARHATAPPRSGWRDRARPGGRPARAAAPARAA